MGITERKERQRKEVRESILQSAWELVNEEGWQNLSIRKIADAIEYSVPVVYDHFENKEAILSEFNRKGFRLLADAIADAKAAYDEPTRQLDAIAIAYWDFAFRNKAYYQLMFGLGMPTCESVATVPELSRFMDVLKSTISAIIANGTNPQQEPFIKVHSFWSMIHGLVSINLVAPPAEHMGMTWDEFNKTILKDFTCSFIKGLLK